MLTEGIKLDQPRADIHPNLKWAVKQETRVHVTISHLTIYFDPRSYTLFRRSATSLVYLYPGGTSKSVRICSTMLM